MKILFDVSWVAVLLALGAASLFSIGAVAQQQEASSLSETGTGFVRGLLHSPRWWAATFGDGVGYLLQAAALAVGSILVVQPLLITALVFALPLAARWNARPIGRSALAWAGAIAVALATFLVVGDPGGGVDTATFGHWLPSIIGCSTLTAGGIALGVSGQTRLRSIGLAVVAGTMFGLASALTKSVMHFLGADIVTALTSWETYAVVATGGIGLVCQQLAFQAGSLEISFPASIVLDPVVSVAVGLAALDERVHATGPAWLLIGGSAIVMIIGTIKLARVGAPTLPTQTEADTTRSLPRPTG